MVWLRDLAKLECGVYPTYPASLHKQCHTRGKDTLHGGSRERKVHAAYDFFLIPRLMTNQPSSTRHSSTRLAATQHWTRSPQRALYLCELRAVSQLVLCHSKHFIMQLVSGFAVHVQAASAVL